MNVTEVIDPQFSLPEVMLFRVDEVPDNHKVWAEAIGDLDLQLISRGIIAAGVQLRPHEVSYDMVRDPETGAARDWWAGDNFWHVDGTRWEDQPVLTIIGCHDVGSGAPDTVILDSARLYDMSLEDGFWKRFGLSEDDLAELSSVFADSTYHREALPFLENFMTAEEKEMVAAIKRRDLDKWKKEQKESDPSIIFPSGRPTMDDYLADMDKHFPPKAFDLVAETPFSGRKCFVLDAGGRNSKLVGPNGENYTPALHAFRWKYLYGDAPRLLRLIKEVEWEPGLCAGFPQKGTFHHGNPGNEVKRIIELAFLAAA